MNKKICALFLCVIPAFLVTQESEITKTRENILHDYVVIYPQLDEGFDVIHDKYKMGQTFYDFLDTHLPADSSQDLHFAENMQDVSALGDVIHKAEDYIFKYMKSPFLKKINQLIQDPSIKMYSADNPAFTYVMKYHEGFMKLVVAKWVNGKDLFEPDQPIIETTGSAPYFAMQYDRDFVPRYDKVIRYDLAYTTTNQPINLLSLAIKRDNEMMVRLLIDLGADINGYYAGYIRPLHDAVLASTDMVAILLSLGANYNVQNGRGETPLYNAVKSNKGDIVKLLLDAGANPHIADNAGYSALHNAARFYNRSLISILLKAGADINQQNNQGQTALILATFFDDIEAVKILRAAGADASIADNQGRTALMMSNAIEISNIITNRGNQSVCLVS